MTPSMRSSVVLFICICSFPPLPARAQEDPPPPPIEWSTISPADLSLKSFAPDTAAAAVVLCDYGETSMDNDLGLEFRRHRRIKIFSSAGYEWATHVVAVYTRDNLEEIDDIEGYTYALGPDGKVQEAELDDESIFKEEVERDYTRYRCTLPALQPGCIVEFRYTIRARSLWLIQGWMFQDEIPVLWSEYRVVIPKRIAYAVVIQGYEPFHVNETSDATRVFSGVTSSYLHERIAPCNAYRWVVRGAPVLGKEPYMTTIKDHANKVNLQLAGYADGGGGVVHVMRTWEQVMEELEEEDEFGQRVRVTATVRNTAERLTAGLTTTREKMIALYDFVRGSIVWTGRYGVYAQQSPDNVLESRKGNSAEISFLLMSLLKAAGMSPEPVIVSTRQHGKVQTLYPILSQFDYVMCRLKDGSSVYYLDATDPLRPHTLLPARVLKTTALIAGGAKEQWATIPATKLYVHRSSAELRLSADGSLAGTVEIINEDYGALELRQSLAEKSAAEVAREALDAERTGMSIDSVSISGKDSASGPLRMTAIVSSSMYAQVAGERIYVNPQVFDRQFTNPFRLKLRKFPVDMPYGQRHYTSVMIDVPDGYDVAEVPKNQEARTGGADAIFTRKIAVHSGTIELTSSFEIKKLDYPSSAYEGLRALFDRVMSIEGEQIVLQKRPQASKKGKG